MSDLPSLPEVGNKFMIGALGESIVFMKPAPQKLSKDEALVLAAWLVSMVGEDDRWAQILAAVQEPE